MLFLSSHLIPVRTAAAGSVAPVAAVGPQRVDPGVPHDAAGAGNPLATLANAVQLGRQLGFIGRRRGRFVQHANGRRWPADLPQPNRIGGGRFGAQFVPVQPDEGTAASAPQPEGTLPASLNGISSQPDGVAPTMFQIKKESISLIFKF